MARPEPPQTATDLADEDEGLVVVEAPPPGGLEDGLAAADAAAAGVPLLATDREAAAARDDLVLDAEEERYLRGHGPERALPPEEMERVDDWDDQTAEEQENLPDPEQQG